MLIKIYLYADHLFNLIQFIMRSKNIEKTIFYSKNHLKEQSDFPKYSHYLQQYKNILHKTQIHQKQKYIDQLTNNSILYKQSIQGTSQATAMKIKLSTTNKYGSCLTLLVILGPFTLNIQVANAFTISQNHCVQSKKCGSFGNIYFVQRQAEKSAIKCLKYKQRVAKSFEGATRMSQQKQLYYQSGELWTHQFVKCLKQYCFYKIFSALGIGPKITKLFGFDIVCYESCFEFSLQICHQNFVREGHNAEKEIFYCLKVMHMFHIVHRDIKPDNLLFSPHQNRYVFTDFGTTDIIHEGIGQLTICQHVIGTYGFICQEMANLFQMWLKGKPLKPVKIDFYYNDLFAVTQSFENFSYYSAFLPDFYQLSQINLAIYIGSVMKGQGKVDFKQFSQNLKQYAKWIYDFIKQCSYTSKQMLIFKTFIFPFIKSDGQTKQYKGRNYLEIYKKLQNLSQSEFNEIQSKKLTKLPSFQDIQKMPRTKIQEIKYFAESYLRRLIENAKEYQEPDFQDLCKWKQILKDLSEKLIPKNKHQFNQKFEMYYFECQSCKNKLVLDQQCRFSHSKINVTLLKLIEQHINLDEQCERMLKKIKFIYESENGRTRFIISQIRQVSCHISGLNNYFKMLCQRRKWQIKSQLQSIKDIINNFIDQIDFNEEKILVKKLAEWISFGKITDLDEIEQLYIQFTDSSYLLKNFKFALAYLGLQVISLNLAFGRYQKVKTIEKNTRNYLQYFPDIIETATAKKIFMWQLKSIYTKNEFSVKSRQIYEVLNKYATEIPGIYDKNVAEATSLKNIIQQSFAKNQIKCQIRSCCLNTMMFNRNIIKLSTSNENIAKEIKKAKSLLEIQQISSAQIQWDLSQSDWSLLFENSNVNIKLLCSYEFNARKAIITAFIESQNLDFQYLDFRTLYYAFNSFRFQKIKIQKAQNMIQLLINRLQVKINRNTLQVLFYHFFKKNEDIQTIQWSEDKRIQNVYDLIACHELCYRNLGDFKNCAAINKASEIFSKKFEFTQAYHLGHQHDITSSIYYQVFCMLGTLSRARDIFSIVERSLINFSILRSRKSVLIVLMFHTFLKNVTVQGQQQFLKMMKQNALLDKQELQQGAFLYVQLQLSLKKLQKAKKHEQQLQFWHRIFDLINSRLFAVSKCTSLFLRSNLCHVVRKIYEIQAHCRAKNLNSAKYLFKQLYLRSPKKKRVIDRNCLRYCESFIQLWDFFYQIWSQGKGINDFKRIKFYSVNQKMIELIITKRKIYEKNTKSIKMIRKSKNDQQQSIL